MAKLIPLLKYLDRSKITPEAVVEIAAVLGRKIEITQAAELANAYRTRGMEGLLPYMPQLLVSERTSDENQEDSLCVACPQCGHFIEVTS